MCPSSLTWWSWWSWCYSSSTTDGVSISGVDLTVKPSTTFLPPRTTTTEFIATRTASLWKPAIRTSLNCSNQEELYSRFWKLSHVVIFVQYKMRFESVSLPSVSGANPPQKNNTWNKC